MPCCGESAPPRWYRTGCAAAGLSSAELVRVAGVQLVVPEKFEDRAVELIASGFDGRVHDRGAAPVFRGEGVLQNLELADGVHRQTQTIGAVPNRSSFHA